MSHHGHLSEVHNRGYPEAVQAINQDFSSAEIQSSRSNMFSKLRDLWSVLSILGLVVSMSSKGTDGMLVGGLSEVKIPTTGVTELAHNVSS